MGRTGDRDRGAGVGVGSPSRDLFLLLIAGLGDAGLGDSEWTAEMATLLFVGAAGRVLTIKWMRDEYEIK